MSATALYLYVPPTSFLLYLIFPCCFTCITNVSKCVVLCNHVTDLLSLDFCNYPILNISSSIIQTQEYQLHSGFTHRRTYLSSKLYDFCHLSWAREMQRTWTNRCSRDSYPHVNVTADLSTSDIAVLLCSKLRTARTLTSPFPSA